MPAEYAGVAAKALNRAGRLAEKHGDLRGPRCCWPRRCRSIARMATTGRGDGAALPGLRRARPGDYERAEALDGEPGAVPRAGPSLGRRWALFSLGDAAIDQGNTDRATAAARGEPGAQPGQAENNGIARLAPEPWARGLAQASRPARELFEESLALFRTQGSPLGVAEALQGLGRVAHVRATTQPPRTIARAWRCCASKTASI